MGKKKIRINFFSRLQSKKSTPPSLDGGILIGQIFSIGRNNNLSFEIPLFFFRLALRGGEYRQGFKN